MIDFQKISQLYEQNQSAPYQNTELVSLFESGFKEALKEQNFEHIKTLFQYEYAYKLLEKIYQQFYITEDIIELILPIEKKTHVYTLEALCPQLAQQVYSYMLNHDSVKAYEFLNKYYPSHVSVEKMLELDNVYQMTRMHVKEVFKYFIDSKLTLKTQENNTSYLLYQLSLAHNQEILQYTLEHQKKHIITCLNSSDLTQDTYLKRAIHQSYSKAPKLMNTWFNFAFQDKKLISLQNYFESEISNMPMSEQYSSIYSQIHDNLNTHLEKRKLDRNIKSITSSSQKIKI